MIYILIYYGLFFALMLWSIKTAPYGYEDENGFHLGEPGDRIEQ